MPEIGSKTPNSRISCHTPHCQHLGEIAAEPLRNPRNGTSVKNFAIFSQGNNSRFDFDLSGLTGSSVAGFARQTVDILARDFYCE